MSRRKRRAPKKRGAQQSRSASRLPTVVGALGILIAGIVVVAFTTARTGQSDPEPPTHADAAQPAGPSEVVVEDLEADVRRLITDKSSAVASNPTNADLHGDLGLAFAANGIWPEARREFDLAVQHNGRNDNWRLYQAIAAREAGDRNTSLATLRQLVNDSPTFAAAQHRFGQALLEDDDLEAANSTFQRLVKLLPDAAEGFAGLGEVRLRQRKYDQAIVLLKQAIRLDREYRVAHFLLGTAYQRLNQPELAARELKIGQDAQIRYLPDKYAAVLEKYSVTIRARHQRAIDLMSKRQFQPAANLLEAALRTDPNHVAIMNLLAGAYLQLGRSSDAFKVLQDAEKIDTQNNTTQVNLAVWHSTQGQLDDALRHANRAVELADWVVTGHITRVSVLMQMKRWNDASKALAQGLAIAPEHPTFAQMEKQLSKARESE